MNYADTHVRARLTCSQLHIPLYGSFSSNLAFSSFLVGLSDLHPIDAGYSINLTYRQLLCFRVMAGWQRFCYALSTPDLSNRLGIILDVWCRCILAMKGC